MVTPEFIRPVLENGWWWELCTIIQGGSWHYDVNKGERINPTDAFLMELAKVRCLGGNMLANIGPRPDGTLQDEVWRLFKEMEQWMTTNQESIFDINGGGPWPEKCNVPITIKDNKWYFHARVQHATETNPIILQECISEPKRVSLLRTNKDIPYSYENDILKMIIPNNLKAQNVTDVIKVEFNDDSLSEPFIFKHW